MRALVVKQPWATLIALGVKSIETRPSPPNGPMRPQGVRGLPGCSLERGERIAIVAGAAKPPANWRASPGLRGEAVYGELGGEWIVADGGWLCELCDERSVRMPLGSVVCTVSVETAWPIFHIMQVIAQRVPFPNLQVNGTDSLAGDDGDYSDQLSLGDFTPGRWGWLLTDPTPCDPIPCKGRQGVFELPDDVNERLAALREQVQR